MRIMIKFAFPVDTGNEGVRNGKVEKVFQGILEELKPEAAYFSLKVENGQDFWSSI